MTSANNNAYVQKWLGYLNAADSEMSRLAAEKLGKAKAKDAVPELVQALHNRPTHIRAAAARSLGEIGDPAAVAGLAKAVRDSVTIVACAAADALGQIGDRSAVTALKEVLDNYERYHHFERTRNHERGVYLAALDALERINSLDARIALRKYKG